MRRSQWFILGFGLEVLGMFISYMSNVNSIIVPISAMLGMLFVICGFLEPKKK